MTVYVDTMRARLGTRIMCHMIADSEAELHAMAAAIGLEPRAYHGDHYDIDLAKKELALAAGAHLISLRQLACMVWLRRHGQPMGDPATAEARYRCQPAQAARGHSAGPQSPIGARPTPDGVS
jgi:hypothetical protein